jgi:hypothetical protein
VLRKWHRDVRYKGTAIQDGRAQLTPARTSGDVPVSNTPIGRSAPPTHLPRVAETSTGRGRMNPKEMEHPTASALAVATEFCRWDTDGSTQRRRG